MFKTNISHGFDLENGKKLNQQNTSSHSLKYKPLLRVQRREVDG